MLPGNVTSSPERWRGWLRQQGRIQAVKANVSPQALTDFDGKTATILLEK